MMVQTARRVDVDLELNIAYTLAVLFVIYLVWKFQQGGGDLRQVGEELGGAEAGQAMMKGVAGK